MKSLTPSESKLLALPSTGGVRLTARALRAIPDSRPSALRRLLALLPFVPCPKVVDSSTVIVIDSRTGYAGTMAARAFIAKKVLYSPRDEVAVIGYAGGSRLICDPVVVGEEADKLALRNRLPLPDYLLPGADADIYEALCHARSLLCCMTQQRQEILLISSGVHYRSGNPEEKAAEIRAEGIRITVIGSPCFGGRARRLASFGRYRFITDGVPLLPERRRGARVRPRFA